jgi:hypothetical protein
MKIDDEDKAIILLCSLPRSYEHLVTTLTYGKEDIKVEDIVAALLSHDQRRKNNATEESSGDALLVKGDRSVEDKRGNKKKGLQCYKCKGWGHVKKDCPQLKKDGGSINVVIAKKKDDSDSDGDLLTVSSENSCEAWLLDSASSFHATSKKELFSSYTEKDNSFANLGDGSGYLAIGVGEIKFKLCNGEPILLKCVKHVAGLTRNLISLGLLHEEGWLYQADLDKKALRVMHGGKTVIIGEKSGAHQYKQKGIVEGGVMDDNASMAVFYFGSVAAMGSASSGCSK